MSMFIVSWDIYAGTHSVACDRETASHLTYIISRHAQEGEAIEDCWLKVTDQNGDHWHPFGWEVIPLGEDGKITVRKKGEPPRIKIADIWGVTEGK
jgi:hypothetical protein